MKPQDILLSLLFIFLLWKGNRNWTAAAGITLVMLSMPLFAKYVFFTAEHMIYFAALYFLLAMIQIFIKEFGR